MNVRVLPAGQAEAVAASAWYEARRTGLGADFTDEFGRTLAAIAKHPRLNPRVERIGRKREFRYSLLHHFPYSVFYEVRPDEVLIGAVAHHSRRPLYWKDRQG